MRKKAKRSDFLTSEIIGDLFFHPPVNDEELSARMERVDVTAARRLVIDRLDQGALSDQAGPLFLAILGKLGIGRQKQRLMRMAMDLCRPSRDRLWAAIALMHGDSRTVEQLVRTLGSVGMGSLAELSLFELLAGQEEKNIGRSITSALEDVLDQRLLHELLGKIESCRLRIGASCAAAYGDALARDSLIAIRGEMLGFFIEEGSDKGACVLERLRDQTSSETARRDFHAALIRLCSRRIDPANRDDSLQGYAWVSNCDGQGGFFVLGVFENSHATYDVADLFLHASSVLCDGTVYPLRGDGEVNALKKTMEREIGCHFVEVDLPEAARLVELHLPYPDRCRQIRTADTGHAVSLFEKLESAFAWGEGSCCPPAASVGLDEVNRLLERPEYRDTWLFEMGDFSAVPPKPSDTDGVADWLRCCGVGLLENHVRFRLIAMAEHMARYHFWNGETQEAELLRALAASVRKDFSLSPLVHAMLLKTAALLRPGCPSVL